MVEFKIDDPVIFDTCCEPKHGTIVNIEGHVAKIKVRYQDLHRWVRLTDLKLETK